MRLKLSSFVLAAIMLTPAGSFAQNLPKLNVSTSSSSNVAVSAYVASGAKLFEKHGLDVTIADLGGGTNVIASVIGGSADVGLVGMGNLVQARLKNQDVKAFAVATRGFPTYLVASKTFADEAQIAPSAPLIDKVKALKGKTIAVNDVGGSHGDFVRDLLKRAGLKDNDVTIINMPSGAGRLAALKAKRVAAAVANSPEPETATHEGYGVVFIDALKDIPEAKNVEYVVYVARADFIAANREKLVKFAKAVDEATKLLASQSSVAKKVYFEEMKKKAKGSELPEGIQDALWSNIMAYVAVPPTISAEALQRGRSFFAVPEAVKSSDLTDLTIAK